MVPRGPSGSDTGRIFTRIFCVSFMVDETPRRQRFLPPGASPERSALAHRLLAVLMAQDGSTTRICEAVAGFPVKVELLRQTVVADVPDIVREVLPGARFIERVTSLAAGGEVMMDNLSYVALDRLPQTLQRDLEAGCIPIGHLLTTLWVRRQPLPRQDEQLTQRLWSLVGLPDPEASRAYCIAEQEGPLMVIAETYRQGMLTDFDQQT
jgi:chorismate-pyruvate lyase